MTRADSASALGKSLDTRSPAGARVISNQTGDRGYLTLDGRVEAVPTARTWLRAILARLPVADAAELVVAEFLTNSLRYSRSFGVPESIRVEVCRADGYLILTVLDQGTAIRPNLLPGYDHTSLDHVLPGVAENGRGLLLAAAMADECGHSEQAWPVQERATWARWDLPSGSASGG